MDLNEKAGMDSNPPFSGQMMRVLPSESDLDFNPSSPSYYLYNMD